MTITAWDCIGRVPSTHYVRVVGGTALYEQAMYRDDTAGEKVLFARLEARADGLHQVSRYIDADTACELVNTHTGKVENDALEG